MRNFYLYSLEKGNICLECNKYFSKDNFNNIYAQYLEYTKENNKLNFIGYLIEYHGFSWPDPHAFLAVLPENKINFDEYGTT